MIDIANALVRLNFDVSLITGRLIERDKTLSDKIQINRIIKYRRSSNFLRILSWLTGFLQILFIVKTRYRNDYLFIVSNPPLSPLIMLFCKNRFSLMIFDVNPDTLSNLGILSEKSLIIRIWKKANRKVYVKADEVFSLTESMAHLLKQYCDRKKIIVTPIWSDNQFFKPVLKELNPFVTEYNLKNKFVVLYSGNLGTIHNVEMLPQLALKVKNQNVIFLFIGEGDRKKWLSEQIKKLGIKNCLILPRQPVEIIPFSFASADLAIVSLDILSSSLSLPSKTFNFMSAGLPLLCIAGHDSTLNGLVTKYENGKCFLPSQIDEIVSFINEVEGCFELKNIYKANSLKASLDFTPENAGDIAQIIKNVIEPN
jgi:glycosyltransferase involved in cell wall biosynthesis